MYHILVVLLLIFVFLLPQSTFAELSHEEKEKTIQKLKAMGLNEHQIDEVLNMIEDNRLSEISVTDEEIGPDEGIPEVEIVEEGVPEDEKGAEPVVIPEMVVKGKTEKLDNQYRITKDDHINIETSDTAKLLQRIPGANVSSNGPITGIPMRRGQSYSSGRVNVLVDGVSIEPSGPNYMDPPLSKISPAELESLDVTRGIASVSSGIETYAGTIEAKSKKGDYGEGSFPQLPQFHGEATVGINSNNDNGYGYVSSSLANKHNILRFSAVRENGDNIEFDRGEINPTEFERDYWTISHSFRYGDHEFGMKYKDLDEDDSGTPSLPMDIIYFESKHSDFYYNGRIGMVDINASMNYYDIDHEMNNFKLRDTPMAMHRFVEADNHGSGYKIHFAMEPIRNLQWRFGFDGDRYKNNATIRNPNNAAFFVLNYHDASKWRYSGFTEWDMQFTERISGELGFRYKYIAMDSDRANSSPAQFNPFIRTLTEQFNAANRNQDENEVDGVLKFRFQALPELSFGFGAARKTRTPLYQERYLYLPLFSTAGLADGRRYVGKIDLNAEINHKIEFDMSLLTEQFYFRPNFFYSRVHDYIQGVPATDPVVIIVSTANGDPNPLQFDNINAKYYGFEGDWGVTLHKYFSLDGSFSYVRGKRRGGTEDDLYRIPPFNAINRLTFSKDNYSLFSETVSYLRQRKVSNFNNEQRTAGYTFMNVGGLFKPREDITLTAGVENLFDNFYRIHLNGLNQVINSDVELDRNLPGPGRNYYLSLSYAW